MNVRTPEQRRVEVLWIGPDDVPLPNVSFEFALVRGARGATDTGQHELVVLDSRAFEGPDDLVRARDDHQSPAILLVDPGHLDALRSSVGVRDEVVLHDTPPAMVAWRMRQLLRRCAAARDQLTGLLNRRGFQARLAILLARAAPDNPVSALVMDIDEFKAVNDRYGHLVGDRALRRLAELVQSQCRRDAVVARLGGDEIAVAFVGDGGEAFALGEQIRETVLGEAFGSEVRLTVSVGSATADKGSDGLTLIRTAETALYNAKTKGRDRTVHYAGMEGEAKRSDKDVAVLAFENTARVVAERAANLIARHGRRLYQDMKTQADVDSLTGLFNRRYLDRRLSFEHEQVVNAKVPLTVALVDIDFFGRVNKDHGWPTGDRVLKDVAAAIKSGVRADDWVARYGGEEFCLAMPGTSLEVARGVLERLRRVIESLRFRSSDESELSVSVSIGAVEADQDEGVASLLDRVSKKLLEAKRGGRNRVCL